MATKKSKAQQIQRLKILISSNESVAEDHPNLREKMGNTNEKLRKELEELEREPIKKKIAVISPDQEKSNLGKCRAVVGATNKPCCNSEASDGYCLIHLKQRFPEKAEDFQKKRLREEFTLTTEEIEEITKSNNGKLWNVSKNFIKYFKQLSRRGSQ